MAGYDDSEIIARVRARLDSDPAVSRRAAIIAEAGESSLRRIEMKMKAVPEGEEAARLSGGIRGLAREFMGDHLARHGYGRTEGSISSYNADSIWVSTSDGMDRRFEYPVLGSVRRGTKVVVHHVGDRAVMLENQDTGRRHPNVFAPISIRGLWAWVGAFAVALVWLTIALFGGGWGWPLALLIGLVLQGAVVTFKMMAFGESLGHLIAPTSSRGAVVSGVSGSNRES